MRDGSRFGKLNRFTDYDYIIQYPIIRFASLYEAHDYRPISVFYTSVDKDSPEYINFSQIDFNTDTEFDSYIEDIGIESKYITPAYNSVHSTYVFSSDATVKYSLHSIP